MKRMMALSLVLSIALLSGCAQSSTPAALSTAATTAPALVVSDGQVSKSYTRASLEALSPSQSAFKDVTYRGVAVSTLLQTAGFDPAQVKVVKAVASDGFTVNYDLAQVMADGVIVAYARADGDLVKEDGSFRMILPNAEGKLNVRMLVELQVIK
jgi:hypothetical protein